MRLYLVRHGEAKSKEEDPSRGLTEKGFEDIKKVANYAAKYLDIRVDQIIHSGKRRAKQTAKVLAEYLHPAKGVTMADDLEPLDDPKVWKEQLTTAKADIMLVGHLPHLSKLVDQLFYSEADRNVVTFETGGVSCLRKDEDGCWTIQWVVSPEILP